MQTATGLTVVRNGQLFDGTGAPPVPDAALVIENGRIRYAGPAAAAPAVVRPATNRKRAGAGKMRTTSTGDRVRFRILRNRIRRRLDWSQGPLSKRNGTVMSFRPVSSFTVACQTMRPVTHTGRVVSPA